MRALIFGLMVKRLRRRPLTAKSAVRVRLGLPKNVTVCKDILADRYVFVRNRFAPRSPSDI